MYYPHTHRLRALERSVDLMQPEAMAPHSSTRAWKIPWIEEPGRLQSMGSLRVGHNWETSLLLFTFMHWRRKWQPTPVFLPGESQGRGSPVGCCLWGRTVGHDWSDLAELTLGDWVLPWHILECILSVDCLPLNLPVWRSLLPKQLHCILGNSL